MVKNYRIDSVVSDPYCMRIVTGMQQRVSKDKEYQKGHTLAQLGRWAGLQRYEKIMTRVRKLLGCDIIYRRKRRRRYKYFLSREYLTPSGFLRFFTGNYMSDINQKILSMYNPIEIRSLLSEGLNWEIMANLMDGQKVKKKDERKFQSDLDRFIDIKESITNEVTLYMKGSKESEMMREIFPCEVFFHHNKTAELMLKMDTFLESIREDLDEMSPDGWSIVAHSTQRDKEISACREISAEVGERISPDYLDFAKRVGIIRQRGGTQISSQA